MKKLVEINKLMGELIISTAENEAGLVRIEQQLSRMAARYYSGGPRKGILINEQADRADK